jgi:hypothetical protein
MPGVTTLRGYGSEHQKLRKLLEPVVLSGQARCTRCRRLIAPGTKWDLDHTEDRGGYLGPAHRRCNRGAGAAKGNRMRRTQRSAARVASRAVSRSW